MVELSKPLRLPMHQAGGIGWMNHNDLPTIDEPGKAQFVEFEVVGRHPWQVGDGEWVTNYDCLARTDSAEAH